MLVFNSRCILQFDPCIDLYVSAMTAFIRRLSTSSAPVAEPKSSTSDSTTQPKAADQTGTVSNATEAEAEPPSSKWFWIVMNSLGGLLVALTVYNRVGTISPIDHSSMEPALQVVFLVLLFLTYFQAKDLVFLEKLSLTLGKDPSRGDVVTFVSPGRLHFFHISLFPCPIFRQSERHPG